MIRLCKTNRAKADLKMVSKYLLARSRLKSLHRIQAERTLNLDACSSKERSSKRLSARWEKTSKSHRLSNEDKGLKNSVSDCSETKAFVHNSRSSHHNFSPIKTDWPHHSSRCTRTSQNLTNRSPLKASKTFSQLTLTLQALLLSSHRTSHRSWNRLINRDWTKQTRTSWSARFNRWTKLHQPKRRRRSSGLTSKETLRLPARTLTAETLRLWSTSSKYWAWLCLTIRLKTFPPSCWTRSSFYWTCESSMTWSSISF